MEFYRGRRVLVLGGTGFLGSNLCARLVDSGAVVTATGTRAPAADAEASIRAVRWEAPDREALGPLVRGADVVFSVFGRSGAVRSIQEPLADLEVNGAGQLAVLETVRRERPDAKVVFAGSRLQFGRINDLPARESDAMEPLDLYGIHKLTAEHYHRVYHRVYGLRTTVLRLTNPYGPGQAADGRGYGFVNGMVQRALTGEPLTIFGEGRQLRDLVYIDDAMAAFLSVGATDSTDGEAYNVGGGVGIPLLEIARAIVRGVGGGRVEHAPWPAVAQAIETGDFVADVSKIAKAVDWRPRVAVDDGLARTIAAYRGARA